MLQMGAALGGRLRMVGGAVRDILSYNNPKDYDFCTPYRPEEFTTKITGFCQSIGNPVRIIANENSLAHGTATIHFFKSKQNYEITTLRRDVQTDGRHAKVEFVTNWQDDAARRDFTINAMSIDRDGNVFDYFGGQEDLRNGIVKFVGDADKRIQEDYLRMLRWYRFFLRYGSAENVDTIPLVYDTFAIHSPGLARISKERIWSELRQILTFESASGKNVLPSMERNFILKNTGIQLSTDVKWSTTRPLIGRSPETKLGYYLISSDMTNSQVQTRMQILAETLKMSAYERDRMLYTVGATVKTQPELMWDYLDGVPVEYLSEREHIQNGYSSIDYTTVPYFPLSGKDLLDIGFEPGKQIGVELRTMKRYWFDQGYPDKQHLLNLVKDRNGLK